jgi:N-acetylmuramoyl-L-alanine amidase
MAHKTYKVKKGDCISSIAYKHGLFPDTIWDDLKNSELKDQRKDPNLLMPGDVVYVRDKEERQESGATEQLHRFRRKGVPEKLVIQFKVNNKPRADEAYVLEIDGMLSDGMTDGDGKVDVWIPPNAKKGKIVFREKGDEYALELGHLDPIDELSGVQERLQNLGFYDGRIDGEMNEDLRQALLTVQERHDLEPTGEPDEKTLEKIVQEHGS